MKIFTHHAAAALFDKAEELNQQPKEGWKCVYFKILTQQDSHTSNLPRFDAKVVTHMLARMNGYAYFCDNGEIFILYRGNYNSLLTRLSMYLWSLCSNHMIFPANHQLFSLFDLNGQWRNFYRFCEKRYVDSIANSEMQTMFPQHETPIPAELLYNDHVAGYLNSK